MTKKWAATAIAVFVSIPLIPLLVSAIDHLMRTDVAMVFPTKAWTVSQRGSMHKSDAGVWPIPAVAPVSCRIGEGKRSSRTTAIGHQAPCKVGSHRGRFMLPLGGTYLGGDISDAAGKCCMFLRFDRLLVLDQAALVAGNLHSFYIYKDADSSLNHGIPSGWFANPVSDLSSISLEAGCVDGPASATAGCYPLADTSALDTIQTLIDEGDATEAREVADALDYALHRNNHGDYLSAENGCFSGAAATQCALQDAYESGDIALLSETVEGTPKSSGRSQNPPTSAAYATRAATIVDQAHTQRLQPRGDAGDEPGPNHKHQRKEKISFSPGEEAYGPAQSVVLSDFSPVLMVFDTVNKTPNWERTFDQAEMEEDNGGSGSKNGGKQIAAQVPSRNQPIKSGWYSLDLLGQNSAVRGKLEMDFISDDGTRQSITLEGSGTSGERAAWIHFSRPGTLTVTAIGEDPTLREVSYAELIRRFQDITLAKAELTVFFLCEFVPIFVWILIVCALRTLAYWAIRRLPRALRARTTDEVDTIFAVAKWAGVGCYLLWTAKDILSGLGITCGG